MSNQTSVGGSGSDRRASQRYAVHLDAALGGSGFEGIPCTVRDYCAGGMFVAWVEGQPNARAYVQSGQPVNVKFASGGNEFNIDATVARVLEGGTGVQFAGPNAGMLQALDDAAKDRDNLPTPPKRDVPTDAAQIFASCRTIVSEQLQPAIASFFSRVDETLFIRARDATNNVQQGEYFASMNLLQAKRESLESEIHQNLLNQFDDLTLPANQRRVMGEDTARLSLVDKDEFEELLIIAEIVSDVEQRYKDELWRIERRLTQICTGVIDRSSNPVGPSSLCRAVSTSMRDLGIDPLHLKIVYEVLEDSVVPRLESLYRDLDELLRDSGLVPGLQEQPTEADSQAQERGRRRESRDALSEAEANSPSFDASLSGSFDGSLPPAGVGPGVSGQPVGQGHAGVSAQPVPGAGANQPASGMPAATPGVSSGNVGSPMQAPVGGGQAGAPAQPIAGGQQAGVPAAQPAGDVVTGGQVSDGQAAPAGDDVPGFPSLDGGLAQPQQGEPALTPGGPPGATESGAHGVGTQDPAVFGAGGGVPRAVSRRTFQAARNILGLQRELQQLPGGGGHGAGAPAPSNLPSFSPNELVNAMTALDSEDQGPWGEETSGVDFHQRLVDFLEKHEGGGRAKQIGERESDALQMVSGLVQSIDEDEFLPAAVKPQIRALRTPLHKLALVDENFLQDTFHPARRVINELAKVQLGEDGEQDEQDLEAQEKVTGIVGRINREFDDNHNVFGEALNDLEVITTEQEQNFGNNQGAVVEEYKQQEALIKSRRKPGEREQRGPKKEVSKEWEIWLNRAKRLNVGDALSLQRGDEQPKRLALAWIGEDHNPFVFVNRRGKKAASMTLQELAMQLRRGTATVLEKSEIPAADRALFTTLYKINDQISQRAQQDPVTGLPNRKKFMTLVETALIEAAQGARQHVLSIIKFEGLQEFKDKAGEDAGNSLLSKVTKIFEEKLGEAAVLGRTGELVFGLLLKGHSLDAGREKADELLKLTRKIRVKYQDEKFGLSSNIGMVAIDQNSDSVDVLMQQAESACDGAIASEERLSVYEAVDLGVGDAMAEDKIDWRAWVAEVLAEDSISLRCQRIRSMAEDNEEVLYEILVGTELNDRPFYMPADLSTAADMSTQMLALDRLVIREALTWMAAHTEFVNNVAACSINISSHSIADPDLMDYVLTQLTETMVPPGKICFEISTSAVVASISEVEKFVRTMKEFGCRFALDQFGSGDTAQGYLNRLPVDYLKVDGLFVRDIDTSLSDFAVVKSINEISKLLGKQTIAQQADNEGVFERLKEIGVDFVQGDEIETPRLLREVG